MVLGCINTNFKTFDKEGISLQYPGNWVEQPIPANDNALANQSGFKIIGVFMEGGGIENYTFYMGIAISNITNSNLTEAAERLNSIFISKEANYAPIVTETTLKNGYESYVYAYNGTGASSGLTIYEKTYVFTKDNKTAYYIMLTTPRSNLGENENIMQKIIDSVNIK